MKDSLAAILTFLIVQFFIAGTMSSTAYALDNELKKTFLAVGPATKGMPSRVLPIREKWAVIVGLDNFQDPAIAKFKFGTRNAAELSKVLKDPLIGRFSPDHVLTLLGTQATKAAIEDALLGSWLVKKALPNDLVLLYFNTRICPSDDTKESYLCSYDTLLGDGETSGLALTQLLKEVKMRLQSHHILCLLDTSPALELTKPSLAPQLTARQLATNAGVSVLSANELNNPSYESSLGAGSYFLCHFIDGLKSGSGLVPLSAVAEYTIAGVQEDVEKTEKKLQSPIFASALDSRDMASIALGVVVKSSLPPGKVKIGHPVDSLALKHPDLTHSRPPRPPCADNKDEEEEAEPVAPVDFGNYMAKMKECIRKKWQPPKGFENRRIVTTFTILRNGSIVNPAIVEGCGLDAADKTALDALQAASPLDPLPLGAPKSVQIRYQFDWRVTRN